MSLIKIYKEDFGVNLAIMELVWFVSFSLESYLTRTFCVLDPSQTAVGQ